MIAKTSSFKHSLYPTKETARKNKESKNNKNKKKLS